VVDNNGIAFQVEPIKDTRLQFWCRDNYPDAYFEANGTLDECNEVLERYGMENKIELGKPLVLNLGIIDDEENLQISKFDCEYRATRREELTKLLLANGCSEVIWKFPEETNFYQPIVVAKKQW